MLFMDYYTLIAASKDRYGIVEYTPQSYLQSALNMFAKNFSQALYGKAPHMVSIDGSKQISERAHAFFDLRLRLCLDAVSKLRLQR